VLPALAAEPCLPCRHQRKHAGRTEDREVSKGVRSNRSSSSLESGHPCLPTKSLSPHSDHQENHITVPAKAANTCVRPVRRVSGWIVNRQIRDADQNTCGPLRQAGRRSRSRRGCGCIGRRAQVVCGLDCIWRASVAHSMARRRCFGKAGSDRRTAGVRYGKHLRILLAP
jgi:hypothetical protein